MSTCEAAPVEHLVGERAACELDPRPSSTPPPPPLPGSTRLLGSADLDQLRRVHDLIVDGAPPGTVARESDQFLADHLLRIGRTVGVFVAGRLVAYGIVGLTGPVAAHLAELLELRPAQAARLAVLDGAGVLPAFRGRGLHGRLARWRRAIAARHGRSLMAATAAPANPVSWRNLIRAGLSIRGLAPLYGGWRYLLLAAPAGRHPEGPLVWVDATALERQRQLAAAGYRGVRALHEDAAVWVGYAAPSAETAAEAAPP